LTKNLWLMAALLAFALPLGRNRENDRCDVYVVKNLLSRRISSLWRMVLADPGPERANQADQRRAQRGSALQAGDAAVWACGDQRHAVGGRARGGDKRDRRDAVITTPRLHGQSSALRDHRAGATGRRSANRRRSWGKKIGYTAERDEYYMRQWFRKNDLDIRKAQTSACCRGHAVAPQSIAGGRGRSWEPYGSADHSRTRRNAASSAAVRKG